MNECQWFDPRKIERYSDRQNNFASSPAGIDDCIVQRLTPKTIDASASVEALMVLCCSVRIPEGKTKRRSNVPSSKQPK